MHRAVQDVGLSMAAKKKTTRQEVEAFLQGRATSRPLPRDLTVLQPRLKGSRWVLVMRYRSYNLAQRDMKEVVRKGESEEELLRARREVLERIEMHYSAVSIPRAVVGNQPMLCYWRCTCCGLVLSLTVQRRHDEDCLDVQ